MEMRKNTIVLVVAIFLLVLTFVGVGILRQYKNVIIPNQKYNKALSMISSGDYITAYDLLSELGNYKDSQTKKEEIYDLYLLCSRIAALEIGETICFGAYEQDNNINNGAEEIEWIVLDKQQGRALLVSKYALDAQPYHSTYDRVYWETSFLRRWLNETFFSSAFTEKEQSEIVLSYVIAHEFPAYATKAGNSTYDYLFLLSYAEIHQYMPEKLDRGCPVTDYAKARGVHEGTDGVCRWWTRTPGGLQDRAAFVQYNGGINALGYFVDTLSYGVRPAMWIGI